MKKEERSRFQIRLASLKRLFMWHYLGKRINCVLINEYPKSGGTWFSKMMADAADIPYPQFKAPDFEPCVLHGMHRYKKRFGKVIYLLRDGRDVMVSGYYHFLIKHDINPQFMIDEHRGKVPFDDYENIEKNLPAFIEYMFTNFTMRQIRTSWKDYVDSYIGKENVLVVKYEDLLVQPAKELERALKFLDYPVKTKEELEAIAFKFSFKNMTKREPGQEAKSFIRKGIAGDWKNKFTPEAREMFDKYAGEALVKAGYEKDNSWVKNVVNENN